MKLHLNDELEAFVSRIDTCVVIGEQDFAVEESEDFFGSVSRVSPLFFDVGIKHFFFGIKTLDFPAKLSV